MKKLFLSFFALVTIAGSATAQTKFRIEGGLVSSGYYLKTDNKRIFTGDKWGGAFGLGFDSKINTHIHVQTSLEYVMNGYKRNTAKGDQTYSMNTMQLPIAVVYKTEKERIDNRMFIGIGPYLAVNMFGDKKYSPADSAEYFVKVNVGESQSDSIKHFDVGLKLFGGYEFKSGFFIAVHYQAGFINLSQVGDDRNILRNNNSGLSIGYLTGANRERRAQRRGKMLRSHGLEM